VANSEWCSHGRSNSLDKLAAATDNAGFTLSNHPAGSATSTSNAPTSRPAGPKTGAAIVDQSARSSRSAIANPLYLTLLRTHRSWSGSTMVREV
jgi:hypothetical protein